MFGYTYKALGTHAGVVAIEECGAFLQGAGVLHPMCSVLSLHIGWSTP